MPKNKPYPLYEHVDHHQLVELRLQISELKFKTHWMQQQINADTATIERLQKELDDERNINQQMRKMIDGLATDN